MAATLVVVGSSPAVAGEAPDEPVPVTLTLTPTVGSGGEQGDHIVMRVAVTAAELVEGTLSVGLDSGNLVVNQPLQVPAGTTKEVLAVITLDNEGWVQAELSDGDEVVAEERQRIRIEPGVERVGVLAQLAARTAERPEQLTMATDLGRAELAALPSEVLDLGVIALDAFDIVVGTGDDLRDLSADQRAALLLWVHLGGRLLLDDAGGLDALPEPWRPVAGATYAWAGRGEVRLVDGAASAGEWAELIQPTGVRSERLDFGSDVMLDPQSGLASRAGFELPNLTPLIGGLLVYGFVIGPVVYLVLRRRRRLTFGWVLIPALAVLAAGTIVVAGDHFRSGGHATSSTYVETSPVGAVALTNTLTISSGGGTSAVGLPGGWQPLGLDFFFGGAGLPASIETATVGFEHRQTLEPGQVAANGFSGPWATTDLQVTAAVDGRQITGTVINRTGADLHDVAVFAGTSAELVGDVAAGASATWAVPIPRDLGMFGQRAGAVWPPPFMAEGQPGAGLVEWGVLGSASSQWEPYPTGLARAVGWHETPAGPIELGDEATHVTAVAALAPIDPGGAAPSVATIRTVVVRSPILAINANGFGGGDVVMRYLLPPGASPAGLVLRTADGFDFGDEIDVEAWDGTAWTDLADDRDDDRVVPVPAAAVVDGVVLVRLTNEMGDPSLIPMLTNADEE